MEEGEGEEAIQYAIDIQEQSNRFGFVTGRNSFKALSNFKIDIEVEVKAPNGQGILGYICVVTLYNGIDLGRAFFLRSQAESGRREWCKAISSSIGSHSLYSHATDSQISTYLMRKVEQFYGCSNYGCTQSFKTAVEVVGLQPGSRVWVFRKGVHVKDGEYLTEEESPYCWVSAGGLPPFDMECHVSCPMEGVSTIASGALALDDLVRALQIVHLQNFPAALLLLGAQIMSIFYEQIFTIAGQVPTTLAFGKVCLGKTKAAEAAQSIVGLPKLFRAKMTDKQAVRLASLSTLGFVIDDPSVPSEFSEKVLAHFEKGVMMSCASSYQPRSTFTVTLNMKCFEAFAALPKRYISRTVLVPFVEGVSTSDVVKRMEADRRLMNAIENGYKVAALAIGLDFTTDQANTQLKSILSAIQKILPSTTPQRVYISYGWLILCTQMLLDTSGLKEEFDEDIWKFFTTHVKKAVCKYQVEEKENDDSTAFLENILCKAVEESPPQKVLTFLRTDRQAKNTDGQVVKWICFLPERIKYHLKSRGVNISCDIFSKVKQLYKGKCKTSTPQLFLSQSSKLTGVPSGEKWRGSPECSYLRSVMIEKSALLQSTVNILDEATMSPKMKKISLLRSRLSATPNINRFQRLKARGPGSASRKMCAMTGSPISPMYGTSSTKQHWNCISVSLSIIVLTSQYSISPKRLKSLKSSFPVSRRRLFSSPVTSTHMPTAPTLSTIPITEVDGVKVVDTVDADADIEMVAGADKDIAFVGEDTETVGKGAETIETGAVETAGNAVQSLVKVTTINTSITDKKKGKAKKRGKKKLRGR